MRVVEWLSGRERVPVPRTYIRDGKHGLGDGTHIVIPHWVLHREKVRAIAYICHEMAHYIQGIGPHGLGYGGMHGSDYKRIERRLLRYFGIGARYRHAYVEEYYALKTGKTLWRDERSIAEKEAWRKEE